ncbi:putative ABC transport system permease protein [Hamadaea flava]|uniref:FtsX-like permease family protein n=1 Tax=Hamadaea flava TaxID=1742688 RepID=A0ABV8LTE4_9ACTN|nr:ABC transporter permease [Hamadaea flava]MCP2324385.1 putative ABC transport system permease protein [Hamadaea flava]
MIRLALAGLRSRLAAFLGTFVAAVLAVALIGGAALLLFSVLTASPTTHRFDAADLMVGGDRQVSLTTVKDKGKGKQKTKTKTERLAGAPALPADWAGKVAALQGVTKVSADYAFPIALTTMDGKPAGDAVGHGWASAALMPFTLQTGTAPASGQIAVDPSLGLHPGDQLLMVSRTGSHRVVVSGVLAQRLDEQRAVFVADSQVSAVSGLTGPTAYAVTGSATADSVEAALGVDTVYEGQDKVRADLPTALPDYIGAISIFGFVIGITSFATVFVLTGTVALTVRQRLRELALLRATGATPRQLWRLLSAETLFVTLVAALVGGPLSVVAAEVIAARFRTLGAVPPQFTVSVNVGVLLAAIAVTVLVAQLSARVAARRAIRIAPAQALQETLVEGRTGWVFRTLTAVVCATGALVILAVVPLDGPFGMGMTFISSALLLSAVGAAGPLLVGLLGGLLSRLAGLTGIAGWLAGAFTRAENRRVTSVAVPLALMVAVNAPMLLNSALSADLAAAQEARRTASASVATGVLPLSALPDDGDYAALLPSRLIVDEGGKPEDYAAYGIQQHGKPVLDLGFTAGTLPDGAGPTGSVASNGLASASNGLASASNGLASASNGLAASEYLARANGWQVGDTVRVWLPDGYATELKLTGVFANNRGFGELLAPADLVAAHDPRGVVTSVVFHGSLALDGMHVVPPQAEASGDADERQGAWEIMIAVSLGFTAIAVVNTFAVAAAARRAQLAQLRLLGATPGQIRRMTAREAVLTVAVGLTLGIAVTTVVVAAFSSAQDGTLRLIVDPAAYGGLLAVVGLLGLAAGTLPARLVLRSVRPI